MYVYDTGALLAAERGDNKVLSWHDDANVLGYRPLVPAPVLAQAWRGGPQARISRMLKGCVVVSLDEAMARSVGTLLAEAGARDVADASVAILASRSPGAAVVTSDPDDLRQLFCALDLKVRVLTI